VHHEALPEALQRFSAMLGAPTLDAAASLQELDNVHAEYSRNCNSDSRRLLQVRCSALLLPGASTAQQYLL
jgi:secreted Zn-dependent insulinase-like peptidase